MEKTSLVLAAALTIFGASALAGPAAAGPIHVQSEFLSKTMGIRLVDTSSFDTAPKTLNAQVVNAERFASRGFPGAKVNDDVVIVVLGEKRGKVKHAKSGAAHTFRIKDDGTVERE